MSEAASQELEEDGRTVVASYRSTEDDRLYRIDFADGSYLEVMGLEVRCEESDGDMEPAEDGWEACGWQAIPWRVREQVRLFLEEAMRLSGEELARDLLAHPVEEQLRLVEERPDFHCWSLAHVLLEKSRASALSDSRKATDLARVAERLTHFFLGYDPARVSEMRALCLAHRANGLRAAGEAQEADDAFRDVVATLDQSSGQVSPLVRAEILSLRSLYLRSLRRFEEALGLLREAQELYAEEGAFPLIARLLEEQETIREEMGDPAREGPTHG